MSNAQPTPGNKRPALEAAKYGEVKDKTFVITGAYSGIGVETAKAVLAEGGKVVVAGRNPDLVKRFVAELKEKYEDNNVDGHPVDLGDLASVHDFSNYVKEHYQKIVLINNAGVMNTPPGHTKDGFETQMGVNVIGHFLLSKLLVDITTRQVWVSSLGHTLNGGPRIDIQLTKKFTENLDGYDPVAAYQQSKLGNILLPKEFIKRYPNLEAASLHPGGINTKLVRHTNFFTYIKITLIHLPRFLWNSSKNGNMSFKSVEAGASTTVTAATTTNLVNGGYYSDCEIAKESDAAKNEEDAKALFDYCDEVTKDFQ